MNRTRTRLAATALTVAAVSVVAAGCSSDANGQPGPPSTSVTAPTDNPALPPDITGPTEPHKPQPDPRLVGVNPCTILPEAELAAIGFDARGQAEPRNHACSWPMTGYLGGLQILERIGPKDLPLHSMTEPAKPLPQIGRHNAVQYFIATSCRVRIEVSETSSVDTDGGAQGDKGRACDIAMKLARAVEPKLP
ncbi:DUF3558 domain-containing protein [Herbihabitans rhizosphaerae]|uniref:DUF3558 domain-containing protein n=1 Tax=Herbihabitans rhizosphaerae TaxID=1872711 RepID=UPI00102C5EF0